MLFGNFLVDFWRRWWYGINHHKPTAIHSFIMIYTIHPHARVLKMKFERISVLDITTDVMWVLYKTIVTTKKVEVCQHDGQNCGPYSPCKVCGTKTNRIAGLIFV